MVINDLNVVSVTLVPRKANPPLIIDPDAVLPSAIPAQRFQPVSRWRR